MNYRTISALISFGFAAVAGTAYAEGFDGLYVGGGVSLNKGDVEISEPGTSLTLGSVDHNASVNLDAGYGMTFGGGFHLAGEFSYNNQPGKGDFDIGADTITFKLKNSWAFSVLPGYKFGNSTLGFIRVGYARAKGELSGLGESESKNFNGVLYGIGMKQIVAQNISLVLEYQAYDMKSKDIDGTNFKPAANGVTIGVQYNF